MSLSSTLITTYKSPARTPCDPASPSLVTRSCVPSVTPAGIFRVSVFVFLRLPDPLHSLQVCFGLLPRPPHSEQTLTWVNMPKGVLRVLRSCPAPLHVLHVSSSLSFAPVPSHASHCSSFSKRISFSVPNAASWKVISKSYLKSCPRRSLLREFPPKNISKMSEPNVSPRSEKSKLRKMSSWE